MKKIYILELNQTQYDDINVQVVRAENEVEARKIAAEDIGNPWKIALWINPEYSSCEEVNTEGDSKSIFEYFTPG